MLTLLISALAGAATACALGFTGVMGWGWSTFFGVLAFVTANIVVGRILQKKVKAGMDAIQLIMADGQKRLQQKMARWQMRPPGSIREAQMEVMRDTRVFVLEALARTEDLHRYDLWMPMMKRQIATAQLNLCWMIKDFAKVDELMKSAIFFDPTMSAIRLARMFMKNEPVEAMEKVYTKAVRRLRYNQNVLLAATWSWILVKRGNIDAAFKALNAALANSDDQVLKTNREHLANNRVAHFSNTALGDKWYALQLEEPKVHQQRQRMQWR